MVFTTKLEILQDNLFRLVYNSKSPLIYHEQKINQQIRHIGDIDDSGT